MSDQSLDDLAIHDYEELKTSPHFRVTETQNDGMWYVNIHEQLGTANPFPGIAEMGNNLRLVQLAVMRRFKQWEMKSAQAFEELRKISIQEFARRFHEMDEPK